MSVLCDYFAAESDRAAATFVDGGPLGADPPAAAVVEATGLEPVVMLGNLEALLTGRAYDDVMADPRQGEAVVVRDEGERVVVTITDSLVAALAAADDPRLEQVAQPWSQTEEFWGDGDPVMLAGLLKDLAAMARQAQSAGHRLYCWVCV